MAIGDHQLLSFDVGIERITDAGQETVRPSKNQSRRPITASATRVAIEQTTPAVKSLDAGLLEHLAPGGDSPVVRNQAHFNRLFEENIELLGEEARRVGEESENGRALHRAAALLSDERPLVRQLTLYRKTLLRI